MFTLLPFKVVVAVSPRDFHPRECGFKDAVP